MISIPPQVTSFVLKYVVVPVGIALLILFAAWSIDRHIRKDERKQCDADYAEAARVAEEKAQEKIKEVRNDYKKIESKIPTSDGNHYPAPAVDFVIDSLRNRRGDE